MRPQRLNIRPVSTLDRNLEKPMTPTRIPTALLAVALFTTLSFLTPARADDVKKPDPGAAKVAAQPKPKESATEPKPRDDKWMKRHETYLQEVKEKAGNVDLLFVGDSITDGWH